MLQNARITGFTVSDLLKENQQKGKIIRHRDLTDRENVRYYKKQVLL